eukprot:UN08544
MSLQNKFHCGVPLKLLIKNGFKTSVSYDFSSFGGGGIRLQYNSSDITPIKNMYSILEMNIDINKILSNRISIPADQLRLLLALKAAQQQQHNQGSPGENIIAQLMSLNDSLNEVQKNNRPISFNNNDDDLKSDNVTKSGDNVLDFPMSAMFGGGGVGDGMNGMKMDNNQEMGYMEMSRFLQEIDMDLANY